MLTRRGGGGGGAARGGGPAPPLLFGSARVHGLAGAGTGDLAEH
jgi:hypothetical protein